VAALGGALRSDSEIWWDRGPEVGCGRPDCVPDHCDRFTESGTSVFPQFDQQEDGSLVPLAHPAIDTGMGLERIAYILQGKTKRLRIRTCWVRSSKEFASCRTTR